MRIPGVDAMETAEGEGRGMDLERTRRPWALIAAALLLVALAVVLWVKWAESRTEAQRLRAELKEVYAEAETFRLQSAQAQQRVALLEQQVRTLRSEREDAVRKLEAREATRAKAAPKPPARARRQ